jgi:hypothetical protein
MGNRVPEPGGSAEAAKIIAWLRTPEGERWSECRNGGELQRHHAESGVFASVIPALCEHAGRLARWPEPLPVLDLDSEGRWWQ